DAEYGAGGETWSGHDRVRRELRTHGRERRAILLRNLEGADLRNVGEASREHGRGKGGKRTPERGERKDEWRSDPVAFCLGEGPNGFARAHAVLGSLAATEPSTLIRGKKPARRFRESSEVFLNSSLVQTPNCQPRTRQRSARRDRGL